MTVSTELDWTFEAMGSEVRLLIGRALRSDAPAPLDAAGRARDYVLQFERRLSRFIVDSELSVMNRDPRPEVPASGLLRAAVGAGISAAHYSNGLIDPTLVDALERVGYAGSMKGHQPASLSEALESAPVRHPASANPLSRWRQVQVDDPTRMITRPPGVRIDTGGTGKGLCADALARRLHSYARFLVNCGGDIAIGGVGAQLEPYEIGIEHPLSGETVATIELRRGGVATSGLNVRIWRDGRGRFAHHLLDPSTGDPVWSGLIAVTAVAPTGALEAETLSKMALLLGPGGARTVLAPYGGVVVHDSGELEVIGPLRCRFSEAPQTMAALT